MSRTVWSRAVAIGLLFLATIRGQSLTAGLPYPVEDPTGVGDVDGDGIADYTGTLAGNAIVCSGAAGTTIAMFTRPAASLEYYAAAGDMNADGYDDVAWHSATGVVTVFSGRNGATLWSWPLSSAGTPYDVGLSKTVIGGAGDFDADGFDDVILRAPPMLDVRSGRTGLVIHSMSAGMYPVVPGIVVGDTDGDGFTDFTIAEPAFQAFRVVRGPSFATTTLSANQRCWVGDLNGNGAIDHLQQTATFGIVQAIDGATAAVLGTVSAALTQSASVPVAPAGDVDGDGCADYAAAIAAWPLPPVPAHIGIVSGATLTLLPGSPATSHHSVGDIDGDGRAELANTGPGSLQWTDSGLPITSRLVRRGTCGTTSTGTKLRMQTRGSCGIGRPLFFDVRGMGPNGLALFILGGPIDVDLAPFGATGNYAYATHGGFLLLLANTDGLAVQAFTMPIDPGLIGTSVATQTALLDPTANGLGFVTSNAIDVYTNN